MVFPFLLFIISVGTVEGGSCRTRDDQALLQFARGHRNLGVDSVDGRFRSDFMVKPAKSEKSGFPVIFLPSTII